MSDNLHNIAFINPPGPAKLYRSIVCTFISKANYIWQPQDFINLSAQIPKDYELNLFDCCIDNLNSSELFEKIRTYQPVLSVVALSSIVFENDLNFLKKLKLNFPQMRCLVLGDVFLEEVFWEKGLEYADGIILNSIDIDFQFFIINNEANSENLILKNTLGQKKFERKSSNKPKKVSIGIPRHEVFIKEKYRFPFVKSYLYSTVSSQFGCPYRCNYCPWSQIPVTYRESCEVLMEIEEIVGLGVRDIFFGDPSFGFPKENAQQLLEGIIEKDLSIRWCCYANPILLDQKFLELMKKAGCQTIIIGVDDEDMETLKERYQRNLSRSRLMEFCEQCQTLEVQVCGDFIIGLNSDKAAIDRMVQFAQELELDYASFNIFTVLHGSVVRKNLIQEGKIDPFTTGFDTGGTFGEENEELIRLRNLAIKKFYMHPGYIWRRIKKVKSFTELKIQFEEMVALFKNYLKSQKKNKNLE